MTDPNNLDKYLQNHTYIFTRLRSINLSITPKSETHANSMTYTANPLGINSLLRECVCQAWLVCQSPAVHHTLPCCASKQHWCPPFAVSHISNACCYHLAFSSLNPGCLIAVLCKCVYVYLASGFTHCYNISQWMLDWWWSSIMPWLIVWKSEWMKMFLGLSVTRHSPCSASTRTDISWDFISHHFIELYAKSQTHNLLDNPTLMQTHSNPHTFLKLHAFSASLLSRT